VEQCKAAKEAKVNMSLFTPTASKGKSQEGDRENFQGGFWEESL
jgi:hypothetical protein